MPALAQDPPQQQAENEAQAAGIKENVVADQSLQQETEQSIDLADASIQTSASIGRNVNEVAAVTGARVMDRLQQAGVSPEEAMRTAELVKNYVRSQESSVTQKEEQKAAGEEPEVQEGIREEEKNQTFKEWAEVQELSQEDKIAIGNAASELADPELDAEAAVEQGMEKLTEMISAEQGVAERQMEIEARAAEMILDMTPDEFMAQVSGEMETEKQSPAEKALDHLGEGVDLTEFDKMMAIDPGDLKSGTQAGSYADVMGMLTPEERQSLDNPLGSFGELVGMDFSSIFSEENLLEMSKEDRERLGPLVAAIQSTGLESELSFSGPGVDRDSKPVPEGYQAERDGSSPEAEPEQDDLLDALITGRLR